MQVFTLKSVKNIPVGNIFVVCAVFLFSILYGGIAFGTVYNVNNTTDGHAVNQLRGAIEDADAAGGTHTINVAAGTYTLTLGEITFGNTSQNITITGAGAASTVISMTTGAGKDRIFFINPVGTTNSPVISVSGITFQNGYLTSDPYGGAAICAGGGSAESLTVTNCAFTNNTVPADSYGGGAICMQIRGNLTVDNCTFTNNVSNDADGGAILFIIYDANFGAFSGVLSVTNSTFNGNSVVFPGAGTSNGGAIAFTGTGGASPFNATISNNTFINNTADGLGGAIVANNSPNVSVPQIHFNRFYNNTCGASSLSSGLHFAESSGSVNAENNWWGCNSNPVGASSTSPCNQAGGDVAGGGSLDANPWLQLKTTVSTNPICNNTLGLGNTTTVTTSILNNSDGTAIPLANLSRLIGLPVSWSSALGNLSSQVTTIQASGLATATFTSNGTGGTATVNAQIDNVPSNETTPARASITVNAVPTPTITPGSSTTFCAGGSVNLSSSAASGNQWYVNNGALGGETNQTYTANSSGNYTVIVSSGGCVSSTSAGTVVTVKPTPPTPTISAGSSTTFCAGGSVSLSSSGASGNQWYLDGNPIGGAANQTYVANATGTYTVVVTSDGCSSAPSLGMAVTVNALPNVGVTVSPSANVCAGNQVTLSGTGAGNYTWTGGITDGVPFVPAVSNTISQTNAAMLVGLRKLVATYNSNIIQLRRSSDNAIQDFGLSGNDLDVAAINTWLGGATGFCTILYDQSGNGRDVTQPNNLQQPVFVANGINGKPVLHFTSGQQMLNATNFTSPYTVVYAARQTGPNRARVLSSVANNWLLGWWNGSKSQAYFEGWVNNPVSPSDNSIYVYTGASNGATSQVYENGSLIANNNGGVAGPNGIALGGWAAGNSEHSDCDFMDVMVYNAVLSNTDRTAVESSMGNYYNLPGLPRNILYTVTGTDGNGCSNTATQTITVLQPTTSETTVAICNKYTWNGTEYKESGDYVFHTTNAAGCDSAATLHLTILSVTSTTSKTDATCFGTGTGSITVTPTYGVSPFTYRIGTVGSYVSSNTFTNLKAGKYRVSILDVNGCAGITSQVTITQPVAITGTSNITNATCYGATNGSIAVSPTTGSAPYTYRLGTTGAFVSTSTFSNLKADAYRVFIQDANGCVGNFVVSVTQPTKVTATYTKTDETCPGAKNGSVTVNPTGGKSPYSYRFGGTGSFTSNNTFSNLKAGNYRIYVNDANGCSGFSILATVGQASPACTPFARNNDENKATAANGKKAELSLSPNPTNTQFKLMLPSTDKAATVRVLDVNGKTLYTTKTASQSITFGENFAPGVYMVEVIQGETVKTLKAVKIN